jgi:methylenetetrahydrofolate reductase (NADPH)
MRVAPMKPRRPEKVQTMNTVKSDANGAARLPVSFEFFPPNTPVGDEKLAAVVRELGTLAPEFFSVTYGAGGSTREKTLGTVKSIAAAGFEAAPHLSCVGSTRDNIAEILATYRAQNIRRLVALRGDLPSGTATAGEFRFAAELVRFIRETQGEDWHIEVAAYPEYHPQQRYAAQDLAHYVSKVKAGASSAITQFFFNPDAYFHFVEATRKLGAEVPVVPGIMPILNYARVAQFAARDGIEIPRWVALKMEGYLDDAASIRAFGLDVVTQLCERLIAGGAPALHFYTLNQSAASLEICQRLGLGQR